jgi:hypothetical protein
MKKGINHRVTETQRRPDKHVFCFLCDSVSLWFVRIVVANMKAQGEA